MISDEPIVKKMAWTSGTRRTGASMETHREYIVEIPDYVPPFDPAVRTASLGEEIVRCRDCKRFSVYELEPNLGYCERCDLQEVRCNGFCAWGERRDA